MDSSIVETVCDRGCDPPSSPAAAQNVEKLQWAASAPHPGFEGAGCHTSSGPGLVCSMQGARTIGHMACPVVRIVYKSEADSCEVSHQQLQSLVNTSNPSQPSQTSSSCVSPSSSASLLPVLWPSPVLSPRWSQRGQPRTSRTLSPASAETVTPSFPNSTAARTVRLSPFSSFKND